MLKKYILNPTEELYLENLLENSKLFKNDTKIIKNKYSGKNIDCGLPINLAKEKYSKDQLIIYNNFWKDNKKLSEKYYMEKYERELPYYYMGGGFKPLIKNHISYDEKGIHVHFSAQVTNKEYKDSRYFVKILKEIWNNKYGNKDIGVRKIKSNEVNFDLKLILYKIKYEGYIPTKQYKHQISCMDKSQQKRGIKDIEKYIKSLK